MKKEIRRLQVGDRLKIHAKVSDANATITDIANYVGFNKSQVWKNNLIFR